MLVISSLRRGGAERVMSIMANYWAQRGHQVFLVTIEGKQADAYFLCPEVIRFALNLARTSRSPIQGLWRNLYRIWSLRAASRRLRPDVIISFATHTNLIVLLAMLGIRAPVIVSERTDPSQWRVGVVRRILRAWLYPRSAAIVVQTALVQKQIQCVLPSATVVMIPNPVPVADPDEQQVYTSLNEQAHLPVGANVIVAMGRLEPQKGFDLLIDTFGKLHGRHPAWHLVIFGDGFARSELLARVARLSLTACVHLPGIVRTARRYFSEADMFVLSSLVEGFPNVLLEAMACGLPVVSFDCPSGPGEIIRDGFDGLLVECGNVKALEHAMAALMESPVHRKELGKNARQVLERFSLDRIMAMWDGLITNKVLPEPAKRATGT